jgi:RNA polymerase sigma-70 factor (ECF subfamily)
LIEEQISDEALMSAVAAGEIAALGRLVERHQQRALRLAQRTTGSADLAEDVVQNAFLRVYRAAGRYRPTARFTTWLHRIVVNLCWDQRRKWRPAGEVPADQPDREAQEPADSWAEAETRDAVRRAIAALPPRQRLAVVLHRFEGHSMREVAEITGWSVSAVESCLVRAYRQLRRDLAALAGDCEGKGEQTPQEDRA